VVNYTGNEKLSDVDVKPLNIGVSFIKSDNNSKNISAEELKQQDKAYSVVKEVIAKDLYRNDISIPQDEIDFAVSSPRLRSGVTSKDNAYISEIIRGATEVKEVETPDGKVPVYVKKEEEIIKKGDKKIKQTVYNYAFITKNGTYFNTFVKTLPDKKEPPTDDTTKTSNTTKIPPAYIRKIGYAKAALKLPTLEKTLSKKQKHEYKAITATSKGWMDARYGSGVGGALANLALMYFTGKAKDKKFAREEAAKVVPELENTAKKYRQEKEAVNSLLDFGKIKNKVYYLGKDKQYHTASLDSKTTNKYKTILKKIGVDPKMVDTVNKQLQTANTPESRKQALKNLQMINRIINTWYDETIKKYETDVEKLKKFAEGKGGLPKDVASFEVTREGVKRPLTQEEKSKATYQMLLQKAKLQALLDKLQSTGLKNEKTKAEIARIKSQINQINAKTKAIKEGKMSSADEFIKTFMEALKK